MKTIDQLTKEEKIKLLKLIESGEITKKDIVDKTQIIETPEDLFNILVMNFENNKPFVVLDSALRGYVKNTLEQLFKNIKKQKGDITKGLTNYNVLDLGQGEPIEE